MRLDRRRIAHSEQESDLLSSFSTHSLPQSKVTNPDITRIINSDEIQSVVRPAGQPRTKRPWSQRKNPLRNRAVLFRLNPYAKVAIRAEAKKAASREKKAATAPAKKEERKVAGKKFLDQLLAP